MPRLSCATLAEFYELVERPALLVFFTNPTCGVCGNIEPRFEKLIGQFPQADWLKVIPADQPDVAAQNLIFQVPAVLVFENGKETFRQVRSIELKDVEKRLTNLFPG